MRIYLCIILNIIEQQRYEQGLSKCKSLKDAPKYLQVIQVDCIY